ncbi:MAG: hypothetical protein A3A97_00625 [Candidatus Terrybacteria bacterium RIFCSPLOWO2_01_FULL_40_23]|uniref:Adenylate kinase n=1 Tax=Candidatus Terrybacteria bacterium RIFCSPLOWO2_01_FULL_40_23 TaxID=1802366 RepID=A0A1G2PWA2_9BACT|nr:MAG: hypothetical protein A3A97_00625 [Candidatus Terrybacteria bacterium RIFCSPLOWO2_01_FULL_40_23]
MTQTTVKNNLKVVIICGPPGAGKGTQAELLKEKFDFYHFETSRIIEAALNSNEAEEITINGETFYYAEERRKFSSGELNTPAVVSFWVKKKIKELVEQNKSLVFSGSPRTLFEADQLFPAILEFFAKENIYVFELMVAPQVSIDRNTHRRICSSCRLPHQQNYHKDICKKCGNSLVTRGSLDTESVIKKRLEEFTARTKPAVFRAKEYELGLYSVDGARDELSVFSDICRKCSLCPEIQLPVEIEQN